MKRKFFSLMAAACAALFSFSGLTGCSGGGDESATYGVVTLNDFDAGRKGFELLYNLASLQIQPKTAATGPSYESDEQNPDRSDPYRVNTSTKECWVNGLNAVVVYTIPDWVPGPADADGNPGPLRPSDDTTLKITFIGDDAKKAANDKGVQLALGADINNDTLIGNITINLKYSDMTGGSAVTVAYEKGDGTPVMEDVTGEGSFLVVKY